MHAVHDTVSVGAQVIGALEKPGKKEEDLFRPLAHRERVVSCVSMQEEGLEEQRQIPMRCEED